MYTVSFFVFSVMQKLELVANAPYRAEDPLVRNALKLFAESLYVNVNRSRVAEVIKSPYLVKKLIAGENAVAV